MQKIEESNRLGKTRELFEKISDRMGTFHAKIGTIKDRSGKDLTETEDIKKRWQECKEIEENNRMGKTRHLFKKIRDTKITFHAKMGTIKDRNSKDLQKQKRLRRGGNTQKNYTKKIFTTQITMMVWSLT